MRGERVKVSESIKSKEWTPQGRKADSKEDREPKQEEPP